MRLFVFIFLISLISYSQIPTLDENNNWTRIGWSFWAGGYVDLDIITILGEQVINGKTYKIIYRDGELTNCRLREENGVIYSFEENINDEKIMINLNLEVGDVLNEDYFCLSNGSGGVIFSWSVLEVTTEFIAGANRRVLTLQGYDIFGTELYYENWIEGIGSSNGLIPFGYNYDYWSKMTCFSENGNVTLFNGFNECEPPILSSNDFNIDNIVIYPNPISERSILQLPPNRSINHLIIYNLSGQIVLNKIITTNNYILKNIDFASGVFFYQVFSDKKLMKTEQFIVK